MAGPPLEPSPLPFREIQALLLSTRDVDDFLQDLAGLAAQAVPGLPLACGVTMRLASRTLTVASSDARAERLDESQYQARSGPCLQALSTGQAVRCDDVEHEERWPDYTRHARGEGLRSSLSLPLVATGSTSGALNLYAFDRTAMAEDPEVRGRLELLATQASDSLRFVTRQLEDTALISQLEQALSSRSVIDQAIGILIGRHHLSAADAFDLLRRRSQTSQTKLRAVAADLVEEASGHPATPGRTFRSNQD
ncbi:GAF and ANTAR domain-containing protein [Microlunatus capsulatus]|uniref:GAF domain-containing protein n=1 Tax=Microlunatus capsulatus TaxID=99117 RepID=A0ABS4Z3U4_9ACTN|nr:GAF and ANTAR domain-containing protein [Microlunatus capsulatus]MBP2415377.1 GAF domain-containing protein [Microlunatus capsulatus]